MTVMRLPFLSALCVIAATQVSALSCMQPDVAQSFQNADTAEERYVVLLGTFDFDMAPAGPVQDINDPEVRRADAVFSGSYLGKDGFTPAPNLDVDVVFGCWAAWCGAIPSAPDPILAFVEQTDDGYVLTADPCGTTAFVSPTQADIEQVDSCMRGDDCTPAFP